MQGAAQSGVLREDLNFRGLLLSNHNYALSPLFPKLSICQLWQLPISPPPFFVSKNLQITYKWPLHKIKGKKTTEVPALATGFEQVECIYEEMPGWKKPTAGITDFEKLPRKAQEYLRFIEKETGAKIGMVSTGPDREQTMFMPEFMAELNAARAGRKSAKAK